MKWKYFEDDITPEVALRMIELLGLQMSGQAPLGTDVHDEFIGIWGGTTGEERGEMLLELVKIIEEPLEVKTPSEGKKYTTYCYDCNKYIEVDVPIYSPVICDECAKEEDSGGK